MASSRLGPLAGLARRIAAPKSALPMKGGGGGPVPLRLPPTAPVGAAAVSAAISLFSMVHHATLCDNEWCLLNHNTSTHI